MKSEKNKIKEDILVEALGSNTIITNVDEIVKSENENIEISDNEKNELNIIKKD